MPEVLKLICRENAEDLQEFFRERHVLPCKKVGDYPLLEWSFSWPEGVRILLEFGESPNEHFRSLSYPGIEHHSSAAILLEKGCFLSKDALRESVACGDGGKRTMLLAKVLASRRKKLQTVGEKSLPRGLMPSHVDDRILDGPDCLKVLDSLADHKIPQPHSFTTQAEDFLMLPGMESVYHSVGQKKCAEALYQAGFLDTDMLDPNGKSTLSSMISLPSPASDFIAMVQWHISKGANLLRRLHWTNESVSHLMYLTMIYHALSWQKTAYHPFHRATSESNLQQLITMGDEFIAPSRIPNGCTCPCSPGGCTIMSVILRELTSEFYAVTSCQQCVRRVFECLQEWDQSYWMEPQAFIRSLTFNALGLTHICFAKVKKGKIIQFHRHDNAYYRQAGHSWYNDGDYFNDNDDEKSSLDEFEELLRDLEKKFDELSLPLDKFVSGYWYRCVKDHLLTRQSQEEEHIARARRVGVRLEFCGLSVPSWMEHCIANKVKGLGDED